MADIKLPTVTTIFKDKYSEVKIDWGNTEKQLNGFYGIGGTLQKFVDQEFINRIKAYMPFKEGVLISSMVLNTVIGQGLNITKTPYAQYVYYGKVMRGNPRQPTDIDLIYNEGPIRGAFWDKRFMADEGPSFINSIQKRADKG